MVACFTVSTQTPPPFDPDRVRVPNACQVSSDLMEGKPEGWLCRSCSTPVIDLSSMTREEATEFLGATQGVPMCIGYDERPDGSIAFVERGGVVPMRRLLGGLGKVTLSAALAACTANAPAPKPNADPEPTTQPTQPAEVTPEEAEDPPKTTAEPTPDGAEGMDDSGADPVPEPAPVVDDRPHVKGKRVDDTKRPHKVGKRADPGPLD